MIETEINNSNMLYLKNIRDNIDGIIADSNKFSIELAFNPKIQNAYNLNELNNNSQYLLYDAAIGLQNYSLFPNALQGYYIFLANIDKVISPGITNNKEDYYNGYIKTKTYSYEQWITDMGEIHPGDYLVLPYHAVDTDDKSMLALVHTLPITARNTFSANLVIMLNFNNLLTYGPEDRAMLILDNKNEILINKNSSVSYSEIDYSKMSSEYGVHNQKLNGEKFVISYITSKQNNWKYITLTSEKIFWKNTIFMRTIMISEILIIMITICALTLYFIKKNYNPIKEIISHIEKIKKLNHIKNSNEYSYIKQAINLSLEKNIEYEIKLDRQATTLKSNFIISLIRGRDDYLPIDDLMTLYDVEFPYGFFSAIAIYIEPGKEEKTKEENNKLNISYELILFIVKNIMEEIINRHSKCYVIKVDDILACVLNLGIKSSEFRNQLMSDLAEGKNFIKTYFDIGLIISVGGWHDSIKGIHSAYDEALYALEYARVIAQGDTVFHMDIASKNSTSFYPVEMEHRLINFVKTADDISAYAIIDTIFSNNWIDYSSSIEVNRFLVLNLVGQLLRTLCEAEESEEELFDICIPLTNQIVKCRNILDMKNILKEIMGNMCKHMISQRGSVEYKIRDDVKRIISENYHKTSLCIGSIADAIGKSPYYTSRIFREQSGQSILDYLNSIRISKAKELLVAGEYTQEVIAEMVGFSNIRTFQRIFKKTEGLTPGQIKSNT